MARRGRPHNTRRITPRLRRALQLYATTAVPTQKAAAESVGLTANTVSYHLRSNPEARRFMESIDAATQERVIDLTAVIQRLSAKALMTVEDLMANGKDDVRLRASQDVLDRNPQTSKTHRVAVSSLSLTGRDVQTLAKALTSGAGLSEEFPEAAAGDFTPGLVASMPLPQLPDAPDNRDVNT